MAMMALTQQIDKCAHLYEVNDTMWLHARQFSFISEAIIQPILFSIGIITNILSLIVLVGVRMNTVFRNCLVALAISDLCTTVTGLTQLLVEVPIYCGNVPEGYLRAPVIINNTLYMLFLMFVATSACLVVFIAFIRNMMYLKPLKSKAFFTGKITKLACGGIFLITAVIWSPTSLLVIWLGCYQETAETSKFCKRINGTIPNLENIANRYIYFCVALYGPVMLLAYIANFICIRITLKKSMNAIKQMSGMAENGGNKRSSTVVKITKTLSLILVLDVVCTLPSIIQSMGLLFKPEDSIFEKKYIYFEVIDSVAEIFLAFRPTYNFWIYVFQRPEFRKRLRHLGLKLAHSCCKYSWCPCSNYFSDKNVMIQTSSSGNGTGPKKSTTTSKFTPPPQRLKVNATPV